jgi:tRNA nucleotidyltransferase (CCA-adding enzyme)
VAGVAALVAHHLAPAQFFSQRAGPRAYRRLARKLERASVSLELLERVARADHFGRTTADAREHRFEAGDAFLEQARALRVAQRAPRDVVLGRHVLARGYAPGKQVGAMLERCREVQDTTGWVDPREILDRVLAEEEG